MSATTTTHTTGQGPAASSAARPARPATSARPIQADKPAKAAKPAKATKPANVAKPANAANAARTARPGRVAQPAQPAHPARTPGRPKADPERDLRQDLLLTSRQLLDEGGPAALSMREVARRAGCTHQAPYHYFADRESILATLVADGFDELAARLHDANQLAGVDQGSDAAAVRSALVASSAAYVGFALSQAGVFRIMFRPDLCNPARFPLVQQAGERAHAQLQRLTTIVHGAQATAAQATILWAHVHGLACLLVDGPLSLHFPAPQLQADHLQDVAQRFADQVLQQRPAGLPWPKA